MPTACLAFAGLLAAVAQTPAPAPQQAPEPACRFSVSAVTARPELVAPTGPVSRAYVLPQPDSPIAIVRADLSGITVNGGTGGFDAQGPYTLDVRNVSDRAVNRLEVRVHFRTRQGWIAPGMSWTRAIEPGAVATLKGSARGSGTAPGGEIEVVVLVDSVELGDCLYKPAQALRILGRQE